MKQLVSFLTVVLAVFFLIAANEENLWRDLNIHKYDIVNIGNFGIGITDPIYSFDIEGELRVPGETFKEVYTSPDINSHQGYTTDSIYHYTIHTDIIYKRNSNWNIVDSNPNPFPNANYNHIGDGDYYNGKLYIPMENWVSCDSFNYQSIAVFNSSDLNRESVNDISTQSHEVAGLVVVPEDETNVIIYAVSYCDSSKIWKYNLSDFSYLGSISLNSPFNHMQGITYKNGFFYVMADSIWRISKDGEMIISVYYPGSGVKEGLDYSQNELRFLIDEGIQEKIHYIENEKMGARKNDENENE